MHRACDARVKVSQFSHYLCPGIVGVGQQHLQRILGVIGHGLFSRDIGSRFDGVYSLAPLIHSRIVAYSGESLVNRTPPPCARVADPATPSVSELDVGLRKIKLFSGSAWSTTFSAVENVALNSVCVEWQCTQAYPSRPRLVRIGST